MARAAGVSATAVYLHFDSWTALIEAVLEQHFTDARTRVESPTAAAGSPRERLDAFALALVGWGLAHQGPYQLLFESVDWLKETDAVRASLDEHVAALADDLRSAGAVEGRADAVERAELLWTALQGIVAERRRQARHVGRRDVTEDVLGMVAIFAGPATGRAHAGPPRIPA
ncbi:TetR-like C-terminal domain-containing protein [Streptomyces sp. DSM 44915]|uniref:TetR-like C-terminal domain-containing protein n=1 Tax=Streptomyces chisholmiae TaxID=3075540 RepID=A0ABU2JNY2_9ACTN|nr:TetR-like C-terminal domain-containing protein [Streptomyces sp. DSM 44915]MDT0266700.1 TetR-like C-terminal domain-containing protein [Streptomyces sp. DSM 44915]